ncbi:protein of unknown function [Methanoculleus bourgensis]|uniref:Uncharacterized protein n=1 Tax=Methanoculleus bourgensis TaxID=83986 RepID=A0A0X3BMD5_9EURY|nr:protein of unknown function [Methanoculleus bourgensis]
MRATRPGLPLCMQKRFCGVLQGVVEHISSVLFHLILSMQYPLTRRARRGVERSWGRASGCTQENTPFPWISPHAVDRGGYHAVGGGDRGGGLPLPPYGSHARGTNRAMIPPPAKPGQFSWEMLAETVH